MILTRTLTMTLLLVITQGAPSPDSPMDLRDHTHRGGYRYSSPARQPTTRVGGPNPNTGVAANVYRGPVRARLILKHSDNALQNPKSPQAHDRSQDGSSLSTKAPSSPSVSSHSFSSISSSSPTTSHSASVQTVSQHQGISSQLQTQRSQSLPGNGLKQVTLQQGSQNQPSESLVESRELGFTSGNLLQNEGHRSSSSHGVPLPSFHPDSSQSDTLRDTQRDILRDTQSIVEKAALSQTQVALNQNSESAYNLVAPSSSTKSQTPKHSTEQSGVHINTSTIGSTVGVITEHTNERTQQDKPLNIKPQDQDGNNNYANVGTNLIYKKNDDTNKITNEPSESNSPQTPILQVLSLTTKPEVKVPSSLTTKPEVKVELKSDNYESSGIALKNTEVQKTELKTNQGLSTSFDQQAASDTSFISLQQPVPSHEPDHFDAASSSDEVDLDALIDAELSRFISESQQASGGGVLPEGLIDQNPNNAGNQYFNSNAGVTFNTPNTNSVSHQSSTFGNANQIVPTSVDIKSNSGIIKANQLEKNADTQEDTIFVNGAFEPQPSAVPPVGLSSATLGDLLKDIHGQDGIYVLPMSSLAQLSSHITKGGRMEGSLGSISLKTLSEAGIPLNVVGSGNKNGQSLSGRAIGAPSVANTLSGVPLPSVSSLSDTSLPSSTLPVVTPLPTSNLGSITSGPIFTTTTPASLFRQPISDILFTKGQWIGTFIGGLLDLGGTVTNAIKKALEKS